MGTKPTYLESSTEAVPNAAALSHRIYTPSLDDGYVPQGLTAAGGYLYVSSYKPTPDLKANTGPCRVFRIEMATGKSAGGFDIPAGTCTHSGGLAYVGNGKLFSRRHAPGVPDRSGEGVGFWHFGRRCEGGEDHGRAAWLVRDL